MRLINGSDEVFKVKACCEERTVIYVTEILRLFVP